MSDELMSVVPEQRSAYHYQTAAETLARIINGTTPWVAIGDFLDDWRHAPVEQRTALAAEPIAEVGDDPTLKRWAAFCAAMVEWLCWNDRLPFPAWTSRQTYCLSEPWFLYSGWRLRAWQLATTPAPFKMRNIFGGDRILDRV